MRDELANDVQKTFIAKPLSNHTSSNNSLLENSDMNDSDYDSDESDCCSEKSMFQLIKDRKSFVSLNIMILMEYSEGGLTLRDVIDNQPNYLTQKMIFSLFT